MLISKKLVEKCLLYFSLKGKKTVSHYDKIILKNTPNKTSFLLKIFAYCNYNLYLYTIKVRNKQYFN